jgi:hypothetical protein
MTICRNSFSLRQIAREFYRTEALSMVVENPPAGIPELPPDVASAGPDADERTHLAYLRTGFSPISFESR